MTNRLPKNRAIVPKKSYKNLVFELKMKKYTDKELVNAHAGINGDFPAKIALQFLLFHRLRRIVRQ